MGKAHAPGTILATPPSEGGPSNRNCWTYVIIGCGHPVNSKTGTHTRIRDAERCAAEVIREEKRHG